MNGYLEHHIKNLDYAISMHAQTMCEIEGMKAANAQRLANGEALAYDESDFIEVANQNGMHSNASIERHMT